MSATTLYIAGPMSGIEEFNYPAFFASEAELRTAGYEVLNPASNPSQDCWEGYMRAGIAQVIRADAIAYLPGSLKSRGARLEVLIADSLSMPVKPVSEWLTK